jgi:hypothetical protein
VPSTAELPKSPLSTLLLPLQKRVAAIRNFHTRLVEAGLGQSYEAAHARLAVAYLTTTVTRLKMVAEKKLPQLPAARQAAADQSYIQTTTWLCDGLEKTVQAYEKSPNPQKQRIWQLWSRSGKG